MAAVEELPEKLGWGFANILVKGKKGLLICLYLPYEVFSASTVKAVLLTC